LSQFTAKQIQSTTEKIARLGKVQKEKQEAGQKMLQEVSEPGLTLPDGNTNSHRQAKNERASAECERAEIQAKIEENEKYIRTIQKKVDFILNPLTWRSAWGTHYGVVLSP